MDNFIIQDSRSEHLVAHPSTQGALAALDWLQKNGINPLNMLDIGCGSGVLSLAAMRSWSSLKVVASDVSLRALSDCEETMRLAGFSERISVVRSQSAGDAAIMSHAPYELVIANVLAAYHIAQAATYRRLVKQGHWLVLSGIMMWESAAVVSAIEVAGFSPHVEFRNDTWCALVCA